MKNNKPIRILQYIGSLNVGGSQTMIMEIYRKIDKSKIQFDFIIDRGDELFFSEEIINMGGKIYTLKNINEVNFFEFKKQWQNFFISHKEYKVIHCHVRSVASIILKIAKNNCVKTICHSHSTSNGSGIKSFIKKILQSNIKSNCDYFFACSNDSGKWLFGKSWDIKSKNCVLINNAIDVKKYIYNKVKREEIRKKFKIEDRIVLGQVGRIELVKNHEFTLNILKKLLTQSDKYCLLIVGDGSLRDFISSKADELNIKDKVLILGNRNDVNELMQAMDIYIMPSFWEGLPLSLIEAQAADLPCVISDTISDGILDNNIVKKINLKSNVELWCDTINSFSNHKRKNKSNLIISNKFDINDNVKLIEKTYIGMEKVN